MIDNPKQIKFIKVPLSNKNLILSWIFFLLVVVVVAFIEIKWIVCVLQGADELAIAANVPQVLALNAAPTLQWLQVSPTFSFFEDAPGLRMRLLCRNDYGTKHDELKRVMLFIALNIIIMNMSLFPQEFFCCAERKWGSSRRPNKWLARRSNPHGCSSRSARPSCRTRRAAFCAAQPTSRRAETANVPQVLALNAAQTLQWLQVSPTFSFFEDAPGRLLCRNDYGGHHCRLWLTNWS